MSPSRGLGDDRGAEQVRLHPVGGLGVGEAEAAHRALADDLGGNSLFAVRVGAALRARGLPSLRLRELYRNPTIQGTVESLEETATA
ncbi:acyl carrier protein [Streptomyces ipomoeae]|uniref:acyl carrier protein n=1 Tax=Streptomyces ipomoeae TaxID=103232 RepID=UPI0035A73C82